MTIADAMPTTAPDTSAALADGWQALPPRARTLFVLGGLLHLGAHGRLTAKPALKAFYSIARGVQGR